MPRQVDIREYAGQQLERLHANLCAALSSGEVEAVHQARVASRRLEEPLQLCRPWARRKQVSRAIKHLKRIRQAFAAVRDLDVLQISLAADPIEGLGAEDVEELNQRLSAERARRLLDADKKCSRLKMKDLDRDVESVMDGFGGKGRGTAEAISDRLRGLIGERAELVLAEDRAGALPADLHPMRLRFKRLRYALELQAEIADTSSGSVIKEFKNVQDLLGDWNDQLQAARRFSGLARRRKLMMERPASSAALLAHAGECVKRSRELADRFDAAWIGFKNTVRALAAGRYESMGDDAPKRE